MVRQAMSGWESGDIDEEITSRTTGGQFSTTPNTLTGFGSINPRTGDFAFAWRANAISSGTTMRAVIPFDSSSEVWVRLGFLPHINTANDVENIFLEFRDAAGTTILQFRYFMQNGNVRIMRGATEIGTAPIGTISNLDVWHALEIRYVPLNTNGIVEFYVNGVLVTNVTGVDTTDGQENVAAIVPTFQRLSTGGTSDGVVFDDLAVNDTAGLVNDGQIGRGGIVAMIPDGDSSVQWTPSAGAVNFAMVDERPPDADTTYVETDTVNNRDLYTLTGEPAAGVVAAIAVRVRGRFTDAGGPQIATTINPGLGAVEGTTFALEAEYRTFRDIYDQNPDTTAAWTVSDLATLLAGMTAK